MDVVVWVVLTCVFGVMFLSRFFVALCCETRNHAPHPREFLKERPRFYRNSVESKPLGKKDAAWTEIYCS